MLCMAVCAQQVKLSPGLMKARQTFSKAPTSSHFMELCKQQRKQQRVHFINAVDMQLVLGRTV
jgi:hypothetical protein